MIPFITGLFIGGFVGFLVCAVCSASRSDDKPADPHSKETKEDPK